MRWLIALDVAAVVVFVAVGRRSHDEGSSLPDILATAAPFLIALVIGWLVARAWQAPLAWPTGITVWAVTAGGGMLLRRFAFGDGTAASFIVAGSVFLGAFLLVWRALVLWLRPG